MLSRCDEQFLILHVPDRLNGWAASQIREVRNELADPNLRGCLAQFLKQTQDVAAGCVVHGSRSATGGGPFKLAVGGVAHAISSAIATILFMASPNWAFVR